jgi:glycosyltransferase involved in cell wall biosynthesis
MKLSIISPAYNEEEVLPYFILRVEKVCEKLLADDEIKDYEVVITNDGSTDNTWDIIKENHARNSRIKGVKFSKNFGHHSAITAGLDHAKGDFIVYMDSDLQAQPEDIPRTFREFLNGFDVVWGVAKKRKETFLITLGSKAFYWIFNKIAGTKVPKEAVIAGCSRIVAENIKRLKEVRQFSLAQWTYVGFRTSFIEVDKKERLKGIKKYSFIKRVNLALVGLIGFSKFPLRISSFMGFMMSFIGFTSGIYIILRKIILGISVAGYASLFAAVTFFFGIQFLILGIMGEYIGIIIDEVKKRPVYIVAEILD